jgi:hypothetical protein
VFFYGLFSIIIFNLNQIIKLTDLIGYSQVNDTMLSFSYLFKNTNIV